MNSGAACHGARSPGQPPGPRARAAPGSRGAGGGRRHGGERREARSARGEGPEADGVTEPRSERREARARAHAPRICVGRGGVRARRPTRAPRAPSRPLHEAVRRHARHRSPPRRRPASLDGGRVERPCILAVHDLRRRRRRARPPPPPRQAPAARFVARFVRSSASDRKMMHPRAQAGRHRT